MVCEITVQENMRLLLIRRAAAALLVAKELSVRAACLGVSHAHADVMAQLMQFLGRKMVVRDASHRRRRRLLLLLLLLL